MAMSPGCRFGFIYLIKSSPGVIFHDLCKLGWTIPSAPLLCCYPATPTSLLLLICSSCCSQLSFGFLGYATYPQPTPRALVSGELGGEPLHSPAPAVLWGCSGFWAEAAVGTQQLSGSWSPVFSLVRFPVLSPVLSPVPSAGSCPGSRVHQERMKKGAELGGPGLPGE